MRGQSSKFLNTGIADAVAMFNGERMVGWFQRDIWSPIHIFRLDGSLEIECIGIAGKFVGKPSEIRRLVDDFGVVPKLNHS